MSPWGTAGYVVGAEAACPFWASRTAAGITRAAAIGTHDNYVSEWEDYPGADRSATVAEVVGKEQLKHSLRLRYGGTYLRMLDAVAASIRPRCG